MNVANYTNVCHSESQSVLASVSISPNISTVRCRKRHCLVDTETAADEASRVLKIHEPTLPTRSTTSSSTSGKQQDAVYDTRVVFSLPAARLVFRVPLPSLRLTLSTPVPPSPSLTLTAIFHVDSLQFSVQLHRMLSS